MIFCKKCGYMLDDDARFCTECGEPTENAQNDNTQNNTQNGYNPFNPNDPHNQFNPYNPYNPYYRPQPRPINVGLLVFTIINFMVCGALAVWPLVLLLRARNARDDYSEQQMLTKCKSANVTCLIIGIIITIFSMFSGMITVLLS